MVCGFVDVESSRLRASDRPRSDWLRVSEVSSLISGYAATRLELTNVYKGHEGLAEDVGEGERRADFEGHQVRRRSLHAVFEEMLCCVCEVMVGSSADVNFTAVLVRRRGKTDRRRIRRRRAAGGLGGIAKQRQRHC
jgi:hypothetical protein